MLDEIFEVSIIFVDVLHWWIMDRRTRSKTLSFLDTDGSVNESCTQIPFQNWQFVLHLTSATQRKKSKLLKSIECGKRVTDPPCPIHCLQNDEHTIHIPWRWCVPLSWKNMLHLNFVAHPEINLGEHVLERWETSLVS